ncbi:MAG TPA: phospholipid carrier-dependent glycosyltransferase, partial [Candidatus Moranbacteria bacterium]|nr:phospholipid carrier-dependent glycosyltransferase [Candidatus Moranbacteria bacterium]
MRLLTRNAGKIAFVVLGLFLALSFKLAWDDSLTFDEVAHIPAGYSYVKEFDYRLNPEHPPLLKVLAGLPLLALDPKFDTDAPFWTGTGTDYPGEYGQWSAGHYLLDNAANPDLLIFLARLPLVLVAAAFGWLLFVWGRRLAGAIGGLLALALYAFSPNVLGHAHLVTTDVGIAAAMTAAFFFFINFLKRPSWRNAILAGIFLGVAQVTKFSAVMLYPIFGVLALLYPLFVRYANKRVSGLGRLSIIAQYLRSFCALIISLAVIWVVYAPWTVTMPENVLETLAISKIPDTTSVRDSAFRSFILGANQNALTRPLAMYAQGLIQVFHRVEGGNGAYFLGTVSSDANPW